MRLLNSNLKPKGNESVFVTNTLGYFLGKWLDKTIGPRPHNRGAKGIDMVKALAIATNFDPGCIGTLGIVENDDGSYELYDSHTRFTAIAIRDSMGLLTKSERNYELNALVCNEEQKDIRYAKCNATVPHTGTMKITDRSRALGYHGHFFIKSANMELDPKFHVHLWENIYTAKDFSDKPIFTGLKQARNKIVNKIDGLQDKPLEARAIVLNDSIREKVQKGLTYYKEFQAHVDYAANDFKNGSAKKTVKSLNKQAGLFSVIMADYLSKEPILTTSDPRNLADKAILNVTKVLSGSQIIAKRDSTKVGAIEDFFKHLGVKGSKLSLIIKKFCGEQRVT